MSFNIVDLIKEQLSDQLIGQLGGVLGTDANQTNGALSGAVPGLLSGLIKSTGNPGGAGALFEAIDKQDDGILGNMGNLLGASQASATADQGTSLLTTLLGSGALGQLAGVIANFAGVSRGNTGSLMGMLAPIIIGVIKKQVLDGGMNANALTSMLGDQNDNINAAMPQGFSDQLQSAGFFDSIAAAPMAAVTKPEVPEVPNPAAPADSNSGGSFMKWLLPLAAVVVLGWFGMQYMGKKAETDALNAAAAAAEEAAEAAAEVAKSNQDALKAAQDAMPEGIDLSKISGALDGVFGSASEALGGISDIDSAKAAIPSLQEAGSKLGGLTDVVARLPDAAKGPIGGLVSAGIATLQPIIDKVSAIPGVGSVIEPVIQPLMDALNGLAG
ncbi:MAG: DUF937 domain-containing protein [Granulosicoccus sp.]